MKLAILTNILTPYRVFFFDLIKEELGKDELQVFVMTDKLPLRPWNYSELKRSYTKLLNGTKFFVHGVDYLLSHNVNKEILSFSPDILIIAGSWTYPTTWKVLLSNRIRANTKLLFWTESHNHTGLQNSTKAKTTIWKMKRFIMNRFDGYCVPGKYALETISEFVDVNQKIIVRLPNLVDDQYYGIANDLRKNKSSLRKFKNLNISNFIFFTPASMRDLKGQLPFFENVTDAVRNKPVTFILAGEGPDRERIERIKKENGLDIVIYNYQNQEQIRELLAISDAFLLPSLSDANPLSNIEAAWAGLPLCISCYVGNGPELVEDGVNGVIFNTLDKKSVCEKIEFIIRQNESWLKNAGRISYKKAKDGFDSKEESKRFVESLSKIND